MEHGLHEDTPFAACMNRQQALQRHNVSQTRTSDLKVGMHAALKGTPNLPLVYFLHELLG